MSISFGTWKQKCKQCSKLRTEDTKVGLLLILNQGKLKAIQISLMTATFKGLDRREPLSLLNQSKIQDAFTKQLGDIINQRNFIN